MKINYKYDVALSFAGENRNYVNKVANCLKEKGIKVFYDKDEEAELWGKDLYTHLDDVYKNKAKYCVVFISKEYEKKLWTNHELKSVMERAFKEKGDEYILPALFDDTEIPGIRSTMGRIDISQRTPEELCNLIIEKVKGNTFSKMDVPFKKSFDVYMPNVKKQFSDLEKKKFLDNTFSHLKEYFTEGLRKLESTYDFIETEFEDMTEKKFICTLYKYGKISNECKIWIGSGMISRNSICYLEGTGIDKHNDNGHNDSIVVEDNGKEMFLHALMAGMFGRAPIDVKTEMMTVEGAAKYLWHRFTKSLEY